ncbi:hypothetical protein L2E82_43833 [Cichorium intybus]|uniref:Uncharacterized protein n=1 Tax=Cichorium intybus TaxID=13427 RepID=A0ACB8ZP52_CICIN|nr:hypothetical protein L2E82_43833 [Cichorium intybus]
MKTSIEYLRCLPALASASSSPSLVFDHRTLTELSEDMAICNFPEHPSPRVVNPSHCRKRLIPRTVFNPYEVEFQNRSRDDPTTENGGSVMGLLHNYEKRTDAVSLVETDPVGALTGFAKVVQMEPEKAEWGFKALKQTVKLYYRLGRYKEMTDAYREMLTYIKSATNLKLCKIWFDMGEYGRMNKILKELHKSCQRADGTDDQKKRTQLLEKVDSSDENSEEESSEEDEEPQKKKENQFAKYNLV